MEEIVLHVCYKPYTVSSPFYLGSSTALEPYSRGSSLSFPSLWSLSGAFFSSLLHVANLRECSSSVHELFECIEKLVTENKIRIYGPFICSYDDLCQKTSEIIVPLVLQGNETLAYMNSLVSGSATLIGETEPVLIHNSESQNILEAAPFSLKERKLFASKRFRFYLRKEERIGISLLRDAKTVDVRRGSIYSYEGINVIKICRQGRCIPFQYCIEVIINKNSPIDLHLPSGVLRKIINFGGKRSLAVMNIARSEAILAPLINDNGSNTRLALSHIGLQLGKEGFTTFRGEVIKSFRGIITVLHGWKYRGPKGLPSQRGPVYAFTPGTLYRVQKYLDNFTLSKLYSRWDYQLLSSSIPVYGIE